MNSSSTKSAKDESAISSSHCMGSAVRSMLALDTAWMSRIDTPRLMSRRFFKTSDGKAQMGAAVSRWTALLILCDALGVGGTKDAQYVSTEKQDWL